MYAQESKVLSLSYAPARLPHLNRIPRVHRCTAGLPMRRRLWDARNGNDGEHSVLVVMEFTRNAVDLVVWGGGRCFFTTVNL